MMDRYVLVVSLWIHPGQEAAFEAFEGDAARAMAKHGGRIDQAVRLAPGLTPGGGGEPPFEVHVVSFPNRAAADSYGADPEFAGLRSRRSGIIARTEVLAGQKVGPYPV